MSSLYKNSKILTVVAINQEISTNQWGKRGTLVYSGIGKINTCINLYGAIMKFKPDLVLNLGSAGSLKKDLRGVVEVSSVIERDFDARPLCERGLIPFEDHKNKYSSGFDGVVCASGDSFVHEEDSWLTENLVDVVDMELFAIAKVSKKLGVPWRSFKYITDDTNESSGKDWNENLVKADGAFQLVLERILSKTIY